VIVNLFPTIKPRKLPLFKPVSIDDRIRQHLKTRAFWRYLLSGIGGAKPLHPEYVCWWDSCENLGAWSFTAGVSASIDTADYQENVGSLFVDVPADSASDQNARLNGANFSWCDEYLGFWAQIAKPRYVEFFGVYLDADNLMDFYTTTGDTWACRVRYAAAENTYNTEVSYLPLGTWFWLEIRKNPAGEYRFRVDGVEKWILAQTDFGTPTLFMATCRRQVGVDHAVKVDYVRVADRFEYPPA